MRFVAETGIDEPPDRSVSDRAATRIDRRGLSPAASWNTSMHSPKERASSAVLAPHRSVPPGGHARSRRGVPIPPSRRHVPKQAANIQGASAPPAEAIAIALSSGAPRARRWLGRARLLPAPAAGRTTAPAVEVGHASSGACWPAAR